LVFYDVAKLTEGDDDPLIGSIASEQFPTVSTPGTSMAVTPDDRRLIVANHPTYSITVVDLDRVRASGPSSDAVILQMPTATWPSKPVVSRDGERLYLALGLGPPHRLGEPDRPGHQVYPGIPDAADICRHSRPEDGNGQFRPGVVQVFNLARLLTSSQTSASSTFIAGCEPTNFAFSPDEGTIYVAPRADDDVLTFDMASAAEQRMPSPIGVVPVLATGPTGIAVAQNGRTLVVSNSHDRDMSGPTFLTVIDAARVAEGRAAIRGTIPTRSIKIQSVVVANDGHTVFIPNREANLLQVVDLERVALSPLPAAAER
jgi:DNA-binding beta-propeller fold protein YncE